MQFWGQCIDGKADQVGNQVDNTGENAKNLKKLYPIFDISSMYRSQTNIGYDKWAQDMYAKGTGVGFST